jgi:hypothetical protein
MHGKGILGAQKARNYAVFQARKSGKCGHLAVTLLPFLECLFNFAIDRIKLL